MNRLAVKSLIRAWPHQRLCRKRLQHIRKFVVVVA